MADSTLNHSSTKYDIKYYSERNQDRDRPALWFYERIIRHWVKPGRILDYGCGTGFLLKRLSRSYKVAGFDISNDALAVASRNVNGLQVYHNCDLLPEASFTGIVSLHVLEHIDRSVIPSVLKCWYRALLPQGRVLCVVPDFDGRGHALAGEHWTGHGDPDHVTLIGHEEWQNIFVRNGFSVLKTGTDGLWCLPYSEGKSKTLDAIRFSIPTVLQFLLGRLILPVGAGESAIFLLQKVEHED